MADKLIATCCPGASSLTKKIPNISGEHETDCGCDEVVYLWSHRDLLPFTHHYTILKTFWPQPGNVIRPVRGPSDELHLRPAPLSPPIESIHHACECWYVSGVQSFGARFTMENKIKHFLLKWAVTDTRWILSLDEKSFSPISTQALSTVQAVMIRPRASLFAMLPSFWEAQHRTNPAAMTYSCSISCHRLGKQWQMGKRRLRKLT